MFPDVSLSRVCTHGRAVMPVCAVQRSRCVLQLLAERGCKSELKGAGHE